MTAIARWLRSVGRSGLGSSSDDEADGPARPESSLYQCGSCDTVYVAADKRTCETCDAAVERVPSTVGDA